MQETACELSAKTGSLALAMTLQRQLDQAVYQFWVGEAARLPHLRIHADGREPRNGIDLIDEYLLGRRLHQKIDAGHSFATHRLIAGDRQALHFARLLRVEVRGQYRLGLV